MLCILYGALARFAAEPQFLCLAWPYASTEIHTERPYESNLHCRTDSDLLRYHAPGTHPPSTGREEKRAGNGSPRRRSNILSPLCATVSDLAKPVPRSVLHLPTVLYRDHSTLVSHAGPRAGGNGPGLHRRLAFVARPRPRWTARRSGLPLSSAHIYNNPIAPRWVLVQSSQPRAEVDDLIRMAVQHAMASSFARAHSRRPEGAEPGASAFIGMENVAARRRQVPAQQKQDGCSRGMSLGSRASLGLEGQARVAHSSRAQCQLLAAKKTHSAAGGAQRPRTRSRSLRPALVRQGLSSSPDSHRPSLDPWPGSAAEIRFLCFSLS